MEKLIELLNEYNCNVLGLSDKREYKDYMGGLRLTSVGSWKIYLWIISKEYGFIKWLVDNDKIEPLRKFIGWETDEDEPYIQFDLVDQYIAYLSIQDNPIEFLISILK